MSVGNECELLARDDLCARRSVTHSFLESLMLIEACVDTVDSSIAAERGGARRLELCAALGDAGTTPSAGMITAVKSRVTIPVVVIVRPRGGGFVYSELEMDVMRRDIDMAREFGADGIAIGLLTAEARIDDKQTRDLVARAAGLQVTCHRAFDLTDNLRDSLESLIDCGVSRVLTSGGVQTALEGADVIASLGEHAGDRIEIMAGGGIREDNVLEVIRLTGVSQIHVRGTHLVKTEMKVPASRIRLRKALPVDDGAWEETDEARIRALLATARAAADQNS